MGWLKETKGTAILEVPYVCFEPCLGLGIALKGNQKDMLPFWRSPERHAHFAMQTPPQRTVFLPSNMAKTKGESVLSRRNRGVAKLQWPLGFHVRRGSRQCCNPCSDPKREGTCTRHTLGCGLTKRLNACADCAPIYMTFI